MPITLDGTLGITTPSLTTGSFTNTGGGSLAGNLTFTSTGQRIIGDMSASGASVANRVYFQNSVTNAGSSVGAIPNGTATTSNFRAVNNSDPTNSAYIMMAASTTEMQFNSGVLGTGSYVPITFYTGGSERMRIDTSGNVGIGTSSPAANSRLYVSGGRTVLAANSETYSLCLQYTTAGVGQYYIGATNSVTPDLIFSNVGGTERMRLTTTGILSIGGAPPASDYPVNIVYNATVGNSGIVIFSSGATVSTTLTSGTAGGYLTVREAYPLFFYTNNTEKMRITSAGDVFVGGTTGAVLGYEKFSSYGTGSFRSASSYALGVWNTANTGLIACYTEGGGTFAGGLTASGASLTLFGGSSVNINSTGANPIVFNTNSSERMRIDASGNIGANVVPWTGVSNSFNYQVGVARFVANGNMNAGTWTNTSLVLTSNNGFIYSELVAIGNENGRNNGYKVYTILWNSFDGWQVSLKYSSQHGNDYGMVDVQMSGSTVQVKAQNNISGGAYRLFFTYYLY